jgi:hypothetical protein
MSIRKEIETDIASVIEEDYRLVREIVRNNYDKDPNFLKHIRKDSLRNYPVKLPDITICRRMVVRYVRKAAKKYKGKCVVYSNKVKVTLYGDRINV